MKFNLDAIKKILKHREPFLFIDSIDSISVDTIEASSSILKNNIFLVGHFPGDPIVPGVLLVETMAQAAGFLIGYNLKNKSGGKLGGDEYDFFLSKINFVKFKSRVTPPATLRIKTKIGPSLMDNFCEASGQVYVDDKLKVTGNFLLYMKLKNKH